MNVKCYNKHNENISFYMNVVKWRLITHIQHYLGEMVDVASTGQSMAAISYSANTASSWKEGIDYK